ncbi:MAG: GGDEF domain-containing protein [Rhodocyclaceae bacterium]|nr:GGDEF domain-containing protein [Rhodocyclaceae bacterium]
MTSRSDRLLHLPVFRADREEGFQRELLPEKIRSAREGCLVAALLFVVLGAVDPIALPSALYTAWAIRIAAVGGLVLVLAATGTALFARRYVAFTTLMYLGAGLAVEALYVLAAPTDLAHGTYAFGVILVILALYVWSYLSLLHAAFVGLLLTLAHLAAGIWNHGLASAWEANNLIVNFCFFLTANLVGMAAHRGRERVLRENYLLRHRLERDLEATERDRRQRKYLSEHDSLTGLPNRKHMEKRLGRMLERAERGGHGLAVLFVDLDGFKEVNDGHGHGIGDDVLRVVAKRMLACVRRHDLVARLGGDEFVVAMDLRERGAVAVKRIGRQLADRIALPIRIGEHSHKVGASIGHAFFPQHGRTAAELLAQADSRMYQVKRAGKEGGEPAFMDSLPG